MLEFSRERSAWAGRSGSEPEDEGLFWSSPPVRLASTREHGRVGVAAAQGAACWKERKRLHGGWNSREPRRPRGAPERRRRGLCAAARACVRGFGGRAGWRRADRTEPEAWECRTQSCGLRLTHSTGVRPSGSITPVSGMADPQHHIQPPRQDHFSLTAVFPGTGSSSGVCVRCETGSVP